MPTYYTIVIITILLAATAAQGDGDGFSFKISPSRMFNPNVSHLLTVSKIRFSKSSDTYINGTPSSLFYVKVDVGSPPFPVTLALDTISPLTWLQPAECEVCFPLSFPFDPINSTTFYPLPSNSNICSPSIAYPSSGGVCMYDAAETLGTKGYFGVDYFGRNQIAFGLGVNNTVVFDIGRKGDDLIAGTFGLGKGHPSSIINQLNYSRFAWCLPEKLRAQDPDHPPTLDLGGDAFINDTVPGRHTTPLAIDTSYNYFNLTFIRLNGEIVYMAVNPSRPKATYVILDAGFPLTMLVNEAFYGLQGGVIGYFANIYGWKPINKTKSGYDLCFDLPNNMSSGDIVFPRVEAEFLGGAVFELKRSFVTVEEVREVCMTLILLDPEGPNIVGAEQQMGFRFMIDYAQSSLTFAPNMC
ncbi:aspartic proteinase nepenthesin-1-like [Rosa rugosa]|uniref:aspartic proteinase nepenthesin-1-like n=1 Tax=Rosa rugosa TaxID=74645 RepID=UPI002B40E047|nr:aspartic proteinase nepenthesin-1-like [Rosa rugosa]